MPSTVITKPIVLHIGDPIKYNPAIYERISSQFTVIRPSLEERGREAFLQALKEKRWGEFHAVMRPFWNTGGEMGQWDRELIGLLPNTVRVFASAGAGYNWADVDVLAEHGIVYCNGAGASSEAVADMAIFHILSVFKNLTWSHLSARSGDSEKWLHAHKNVPFTAHNPRGHSLGIIGLGSIGYTIARKAYLAFGMKILYNDLIRKSPLQEQDVEATYFENLDAMLAVSDCVLVATPFSGKKIIDAEKLQKFKHGSRLVNIARGNLVDEEALAAAVESGQIFAAGLDVYEDEPNVSPRLAKLHNITLTSHTAGAAVETYVDFEKLAMENVEKVLTGQEPLTPVNKHLLEAKSNGQL